MKLCATNTAELIPGYTTTERIGAGGYGEVWRAEAPGGFEKAIKVVFGFHDEARAERELKALDRIKRVRHPFLLSMERAEIVEGRLAILTELADKSLDERFQECLEEDLPGIPREELLSYMRESADALDYLLTQHSLQHLDIKPENVLLVAGHIKVADFGLVKDVTERTQQSMIGGMTPTYAAPEIFDGHPSTHSDQYSLAIVYQQLLTGALPFPGRTAAQLAMQHTQGRPILGPLPERDRPIVAKALSKNPAERFESCAAFVDAIVDADQQPTSRSAAANGDTHAAPLTTKDADDTKSLKATPTEGIADARNDNARRPTARPAPKVLQTEALNSTSVGPIDVRSTSAATALPQVCVTSEIRAADAMEAATEFRFRPTLVLGIGGLAANVLTQLRARLDKHPFAPLGTAIEMLLLDTDRVTLKHAQAGDDEGRLKYNEVCHLPLRRPQQYRSASPKLLQWLSRRWLYNIPRSLQTRGFRPIGRLALVDHAATALEAIRDKLERVCDEDHVNEVAADCSVAVDAKPRVIIVASPCGGTGGGMVIDVAYAVRALAEELQIGTLETIGLLVHATNRRREEGELALANTYTVLGELAALPARGNQGPHAGSETAQQLEGLGNPLSDVYFVDAGKELGDDEFKQGISSTADYLTCNLLTSLGNTLDACRKQDRLQRERIDFDVSLRSFAVSKLPTATDDPKNETSSPDLAIAPQGCGHTKRLFAVANEGLLPAESIENSLQPIKASVDQPMLIYEAAELSCAHVAAQLTEGRPDIVDAAGRLHSRSDIDWPSLPEVITDARS